MKRIALALLLALTLPITGMTRQTSALTTAPTQCASGPSFDWKAKAKTYTQSNSLPDITDATFPTANSAQILFQDSTNNPNQWVYYNIPYSSSDTSPSITLKKLANGNYSISAKEKTGSNLLFYATTSPNNPTGFSPGWATLPMSEVNCIYSAQNITYDASYDAPKTFTGDIFANSNTTPDCDALNFACWMGNIFDGIGDGFNSVVQGLTKAITYLFVPDADRAMASMQGIADSYSDQFGILVFPFEFIATIINRLASAVPYNSSGGYYGNGEQCALEGGTPSPEGFCNYPNSVISFGSSSEHFFGSNFVLDLQVMEHNFPTMWGIVVMIIRITTVSLLVFGLYRRYTDILSGGERGR